ncbi:thioredoxin reductase 3 [Echinops telfairi]|uniref:Thioredoxin reductase 3 n=1 Tax=Echinops telfairi TaxID=9371 RepID=A0AC55D2W1_ECHTE|nr:thioredoxin reductase 3 [Echinops telfairi]
MIFSKSYCPHSARVKELFSSLGVAFNILELDKIGCVHAHQSGLLQTLLEEKSHASAYDYDLIVIGGGSGGLSCAKEAAIWGKKVMVLDFVVPSPHGTFWVKHNWETMIEAIQKHIGSLNWHYKSSLREKAVTYVNSYGEFVADHKIKATNKKGQEAYFTAANFVIATGERPRYLGLPGDKEYCITSDDLFSLRHSPGKTLVVGASYVALECAGFLIQQLESGSPGKLKVVAKSTEGRETIEDIYNTVLLAIGRESCTRKLGLEKIGVKINESDIAASIMLCSIRFPQESELKATVGATCDYVNVPTTVFTPLEYGCCGYAEEKAAEVYSKKNLEVYHTLFWPLEWTVADRDNNTCYAKIICNRLDNDRVIGFHIFGPNAGEITQGFAAAMKCGLTKQLLDNTIGIHPTCGEVFTSLEITKSSGLDISQKGC